MNYNKPLIQPIEHLELSDVNHYQLDNGIPVYELNYPQSAKVVKFELIYDAGRLYESTHLTSKVAAALIKEGTASYSSRDIANQLDFYGAYMLAKSSMDYASINFISLNKHFDKLTHLISETIYQPAFRQEEFDKYRQRAVESLKLQLSKNDVLGYRELTEQIFGSDHPYGYNSVAKDYDNLAIEDVVKHYKQNYIPTKCKLFISGNINESLRHAINNCIGNTTIDQPINQNPTLHNINLHNNSLHNTTLIKTATESKKIRVKGKQSLQKSIYIGARLFNRSHQDYFGMVVLNTLLGGYFSSRLNIRIREQEALSYGVDAQLDIMSEEGFFYISTEVENNNEKATLTAIYEELDKLKTSPVSTTEIDNTIRYIKGRILNSLDGPFKQIKVLQSLVMNNIPIDTFSDRLKALDNITPQDLLRLANLYYANEKLIEVIVEG